MSGCTKPCEKPQASNRATTSTPWTSLGTGQSRSKRVTGPSAEESSRSSAAARPFGRAGAWNTKSGGHDRSRRPGAGAACAGHRHHRQWCPHWDQRPTAVARLTALWQAYEALHREGWTVPSAWWTHHAGPHRRGGTRGAGRDGTWRRRRCRSTTHPDRSSLTRTRRLHGRDGRPVISDCRRHSCAAAAGLYPPCSRRDPKRGRPGRAVAGRPGTTCPTSPASVRAPSLPARARTPAKGRPGTTVAARRPPRSPRLPPRAVGASFRVAAPSTGRSERSSEISFADQRR